MGQTTFGGGLVAGGTLALTGFSALFYCLIAAILIVVGILLVRATVIKVNPR